MEAPGSLCTRSSRRGEGRVAVFGELPASRAESRPLVTPTSFSVPRDVAQQTSILEPQGHRPQHITRCRIASNTRVRVRTRPQTHTRAHTHADRCRAGGAPARTPTAAAPPATFTTPGETVLYDTDLF